MTELSRTDLDTAAAPASETAAANIETGRAHDAALAPDHTRRNSRVIWLLLGATFVVFLNETIMSVAIPHLVVDLGITIAAAQWLTTAFMLTMAVVIPITGFLLQRFSTRQMFVAAMTTFSTGTLLAALAPGFEVLLGARIIQAMGTAVMMPLLMTTLMSLIAPRDRGRIMGRVSIVISVAPATGPMLSGFILSFFGWRFMFVLVLPFALAMLFIGIRAIENVSEPKPGRIDIMSVVLSALGFGGLVTGLSLVGEGLAGGSATTTLQLWVAIAVGVAGIVAFVLRQFALQRRDQALLDLRTFRSRNFAVSVGLMAVLMSALFGTFILVPIYLQDVLGLEAYQTGLLLVPGGLTMGLLGPIVGRLYDRVGPTPLLVPGTILVSASLWAFTTVTAETSPWVALAMHVLLSIGLGFTFTPLFTSALGSIESRFYSHGSAIIGTAQQLAAAAGTALFITVLSASTTLAADAGASELAATVNGVQHAFMVGAIISLAAIVGAAFVRRPADMVSDAPLAR